MKRLNPKISEVLQEPQGKVKAILSSFGFNVSVNNHSESTQAILRQDKERNKSQRK